MTDAENFLWYAAYGSNVNRQRFSRYVSIPHDDPRFPIDRWFFGQGRLRFAGVSTRWNGGVAFVDLSVPERMVYRAYRVTVDQFVSVWEGENRCDIPTAKEHTRELMTLAKVGRRRTVRFIGKYDTAEIVGTHNGEITLTITGSAGTITGSAGTIAGTKPLLENPPCREYLATIEAGLREGPMADPAHRAYVTSISTFSL